MSPNSFFQVKYRKLLEIVYFPPPHTILGVGKNHDLENKKWVTLGDDVAVDFAREFFLLR